MLRALVSSDMLVAGTRLLGMLRGVVVRWLRGAVAVSLRLPLRL
jgi:hypothetical protein